MADVEPTIRALEEELWRAQLSGDVTVLDHLLTEDLLFTGLAGSLESKASDLQQGPTRQDGAPRVVVRRRRQHQHRRSLPAPRGGPLHRPSLQRRRQLL